MINHFPNVSAAGSKRQMIHASHFLSKGTDMKIVDCLPQFSLRSRRISHFLLSSLFHSANNLK